MAWTAGIICVGYLELYIEKGIENGIDKYEDTTIKEMAEEVIKDSTTFQKELINTLQTNSEFAKLVKEMKNDSVSTEKVQKYLERMPSYESVKKRLKDSLINVKYHAKFKK